jgi:hypothetical protein
VPLVRTNLRAAKLNARKRHQEPSFRELVLVTLCRAPLEHSQRPLHHSNASPPSLGITLLFPVQANKHRAVKANTRMIQVLFRVRVLKLAITLHKKLPPNR